MRQRCYSVLSVITCLAIFRLGFAAPVTTEPSLPIIGGTIHTHSLFSDGLWPLEYDFWRTALSGDQFLFSLEHDRDVLAINAGDPNLNDTAYSAEYERLRSEYSLSSALGFAGKEWTLNWWQGESQYEGHAYTLSPTPNTDSASLWLGQDLAAARQRPNGKLIPLEDAAWDDGRFWSKVPGRAQDWLLQWLIGADQDIVFAHPNSNFGQRDGVHLYSLPPASMLAHYGYSRAVGLECFNHGGLSSGSAGILKLADSYENFGYRVFFTAGNDDHGYPPSRFRYLDGPYPNRWERKTWFVDPIDYDGQLRTDPDALVKTIVTYGPITVEDVFPSPNSTWFGNLPEAVGLKLGIPDRYIGKLRWYLSTDFSGKQLVDQGTVEKDGWILPKPINLKWALPGRYGPLTRLSLRVDLGNLPVVLCSPWRFAPAFPADTIQGNYYLVAFDRSASVQPHELERSRQLIAALAEQGQDAYPIISLLPTGIKAQPTGWAELSNWSELWSQTAITTAGLTRQATSSLVLTLAVAVTSIGEAENHLPSHFIIITAGNTPLEYLDQLPAFLREEWVQVSIYALHEPTYITPLERICATTGGVYWVANWENANDPAEFVQAVLAKPGSR